MNHKVNAEEHLVSHYHSISDLKSDFRNYNLFNLVAKLVKGNSVIDIGCGPASFLNILKTGGKSVAGVEPARGMRELAEKLNPEIPVSRDLNVNEKVDAVTMLDVLEHIEDDSGQVRQVNESLKTGGEFIFVVPANLFLYGLRDKEMGHYRRYSKSGITELLTTNGFRVESLRYWNALGFLPYLISEKILRKPLESKSRQKISLMQKVLDIWFRLVENNFDFGFGLSIIGVAKKNAI